VPPCARRKFDIQRPITRHLFLEQQYFRILIKITDFICPYYEEQFIYSFEAFIAAFGGNLGVWLGLDFVKLIELFFSAILSIYGVGKAVWHWSKRNRDEIIVIEEQLGKKYEASEQKAIVVVPRD
jgi:hypothetical protein